VYDTAFLPKGKTVKDILYNITNDSLLLVNSAEDGNAGQREGAAAAGVK